MTKKKIASAFEVDLGEDMNFFAEVRLRFYTQPRFRAIAGLTDEEKKMKSINTIALKFISKKVGKDYDVMGWTKRTNYS